jgi:EAL domain-containing protein (putative c-di-GMP-specific phosphodiesterase class I)/ActR/RegA family two-component response regulator
MNTRPDLRIVAIYDDAMMLRILALTLARLGYTDVHTYTDAGAALRDMDEERCRPQLILLDLNMPRMDGVEFLRKLVERRYGGALIVVSAEDPNVLESVGKLVLTHRIQSLGHLSKPVQPDQLAALIEAWNPLDSDRRRVARTVFGSDDVRAAIERRELVNYYQPVVEVATGRVVGAEVLVRWRHPLAGLVFPDQFIAVAEISGAIRQLTRVVMQAAFAQQRLWQDAGLALHIAVNVSAEDLMALDFPDVVGGYAAAAGIAPSAVVLEVTESRLMARLSVVLDVLNRLRLKRFRLSIDDFGTGHSSLVQLRDMPFVQLKVDRGFVHGAGANGKLAAIYRASLELGQQTRMQVVAEGVEDDADWQFVRDSGCHLAQGYYFAKPMPAEEFEPWLRDHPPFSAPPPT